MDNLFIFIPTKTRYDNCKTANLIGNYKNLFLVVEPQEYKEYRINYPNFNILQLPEDDKGLAYARNWVKLFTIRGAIKQYWLLDDDISYFYKREGTKLIRNNYDDTLLDAQNYFVDNNVACGALEYRQYAWSSNKRGVYNSFCDSAVFIDNKLTDGIWCNEELKLKIDRDFCIKVISSGNKTCRDTMNAFSVPPNGSNKGGLKEIAYDQKDTELNACKKMIEIWGDDICRHILKPDGRNDLKINWKNINNNQTKLF